MPREILLKEVTTKAITHSRFLRLSIQEKSQINPHGQNVSWHYYLKRCSAFDDGQVHGGTVLPCSRISGTQENRPPVSNCTLRSIHKQIHNSLLHMQAVFGFVEDFLRVFFEHFFGDLLAFMRG